MNAGPMMEVDEAAAPAEDAGLVGDVLCGVERPLDGGVVCDMTELFMPTMHHSSSTSCSISCALSSLTSSSLSSAA